MSTVPNSPRDHAVSIEVGDEEIDGGADVQIASLKAN